MRPTLTVSLFLPLARRRAGWYVGDLHLHAEHSNLGAATMRQTFDYAFRRRPAGAGLDFMALTDYVTTSAWGEIGRGFLGVWWVVEMIGFVLLPSLLYAWGARNRSVKAVRIAAAVAVLGIIVNRLNVSIVAWDWGNPAHYLPSWMEIWVSLTLVTVGVLAFRWIVNRMPVLHEPADLAAAEH